MLYTVRASWRAWSGGENVFQEISARRRHERGHQASGSHEKALPHHRAARLIQK
jgi:hypothetical protein